MRRRRRLGDRGGLGWRNYEKMVNVLGHNWWKSAERYLVMSSTLWSLVIPSVLLSPYLAFPVKISQPYT